MCIGIPGRVVEPTERPDIARVDVEGVVRDINMALLEDDPPAPGQWVMIHLGFALERMSEEEARAAFDTIATLGEGDLPDLFAEDIAADEPWVAEPRPVEPGAAPSPSPTFRGAP